MLTHQLHEPERACAHWRTHRRAFPQGRYEDEIARAIAELGCTP